MAHKPKLDDLDNLRSFATIRQLEYIEAIQRKGSHRKAAEELNIVPSVLDASMKALRHKAALHQVDLVSGLTRTVEDPFKIKGTSTLLDANGNTKLTWVKTTLDQEKMAQMREAALAGMRDELPRVSLMQAPPLGNDKLLNCYVVTDYHMGMLSWREETGADWDLKIAEKLIVDWFRQAIAKSPDADTAVFAQLSDFLHFDGMDAVTPASKHLLDVDTRFAKVVRSAIRVLRTIIDMLLAKHQHVHVIMADANHDPVSQIWLREWFSVLYENEPRITVDRSPSPYNAYEFGKVALFFHHGHKRRISDVSAVFAAQFRQIFGRTKYAYGHMGHLHHVDVKEDQLMVLEQHRTLAPADAYAARGGWLSGRDAKVITYHREFGEVSRLTINSDMLK